MTTKFDFDNTSIFLHFDIESVDGELADELEGYLWTNVVGNNRKGDRVYVGLEDRGWSVKVVRYETAITNATKDYVEKLHEDVYEKFAAWVESMGGFENVAS
jgi:hypothetical protein